MDAVSGRECDGAKSTSVTGGGRPQFAGQSLCAKAMLKELDCTYQGHRVTVTGKLEAGYKTVTLPIDCVVSDLILLPSAKLRDRVGSAERQGSAAEMERLSHAYEKSGQRTKPIQLKDILRFPTRTSDGHRSPGVGVGRQSRRLLVLACAGAGKSMLFTRKAPLDWSLGRIWRKVEIVLAFPLRRPEVQSARTLQQLLEYHGEWSSAELDDMCVYIRDHIHRVCVILDGLDEINLQTCSSFIKRIVIGERMKGAHVIVTSRPSTEVLELASKHPFDRCVEITGFSDEAVARYVSNVLSVADAAAVMQQVSSNAFLAAFMRVPVNAVYLCSLYRDGCHELPTTLPAIVSCMMLAVTKQRLEKLGKGGKVACSWDDFGSGAEGTCYGAGKLRISHAGR